VNLALERIALSAERLRLPHMAENAPTLAEEAAEKNLSYTEFLERLLAAEVAAADERAVDALMRMSGFPFKKTLEEFEFRFQPQVKKRQLKELASCAFLERAENLIFLGPPGVGKTHCQTS
jgi:DNA replication protein DnaC